MTSSADADSKAPGETGQPYRGPIRLGTCRVGGPDGGRPLVMEFEARVTTGKDGEMLALEQAAAIREVLVWIVRNRGLNDDHANY
jgi:hypothetical protein